LRACPATERFPSLLPCFITLNADNITMMMAPYDHDPQPKLVPSVTEDDEDDGVIYPTYKHLVNQVRSSSTKNHHAIAYLLRYETMVRQQEAEAMATEAHLRPCIERIQVLAGLDTSKWSDDRKTELLLQRISFDELAKAHAKLEDSKQHDPTPEHMTTDRQLMMVLHLLTENLEDKDRAVTITWAEFVQAYKLCIIGMETLQNMPADCAAKAGMRDRARNRILSALSLFKAGPTTLFGGPSSSVGENHETVETNHDAITSDASKTSFQDDISKKRAKIRYFKFFCTFLMLVFAGVGASIHMDVIDQNDISSVMLFVEKVAVDVREQAKSLFLEAIALKTSLTHEPKLLVTSKRRDSVASSPRTTLAVQPSMNASQVTNHYPTPSYVSIALYKTPAIAAVNDPSSGSSLAVPAILGGIVGAAGAPYAMLILQKMANLLIAGSTSHFILVSFVVAFVPMAVNGLFARMSDYARSYELEFSIE
jgi:hypothetical protein